MARMRPAGALVVGPNATLTAEPGGLHLMLVDLKSPLVAGTLVPLVLAFKAAGEITVQLKIEPQWSCGSAPLSQFREEHHENQQRIAVCAASRSPPHSPALPTTAMTTRRRATLGTVTVTATRPTSLPTQIPTTIEGITGDEIAETINATDSEDALKYFPSLLVRKRYVGDYDHAVLASRASGTGNSARSLVYADGILLSNLLGNGATFTPRWGLVTPEEIERVDVLYGPFSAAYPGNSVGAVVDYVTRMPDELEMHAKLASFGQDFEIYDIQRSLHRLAGERLGGRSQRQLLLVAQLQSPRQRRAAAVLRQQAREHRRRGQRRHARHRRARRPQSAQPGLADPRIDHADPHRAGSRQGEARATTFRRRCAPATRWACGTTTPCELRTPICAMPPATRCTAAPSMSMAARTS